VCTDSVGQCRVGSGGGVPQEDIGRAVVLSVRRPAESARLRSREHTLMRRPN
jgi:hypothetical protein